MANGNRNWRITGLVFRELVGWLLIAIGLFGFWICFKFLMNGAVIQGFISSVVSVMLFRGGLQLVKVAVAARALRPERVSSE